MLDESWMKIRRMLDGSPTIVGWTKVERRCSDGHVMADGDVGAVVIRCVVVMVGNEIHVAAIR
jgi:hypothetical protein